MHSLAASCGAIVVKGSDWGAQPWGPSITTAHQGCCLSGRLGFLPPFSPWLACELFASPLLGGGRSKPALPRGLPFLT